MDGAGASNSGTAAAIAAFDGDVAAAAAGLTSALGTENVKDPEPGFLGTANPTEVSSSELNDIEPDGGAAAEVAAGVAADPGPGVDGLANVDAPQPQPAAPGPAMTMEQLDQDIRVLRATSQWLVDQRDDLEAKVAQQVNAFPSV